MRAKRTQQGRHKPSAVLVAAFEVEVRGPGLVRLVRGLDQVTAAGFEPHIEDVSFFLK